MASTPKNGPTAAQIEASKPQQERLRASTTAAEQKFVRPSKTAQKVTEEPTAPDLSDAELERRKQRLRELGIPLPAEGVHKKPMRSTSRIIEDSDSLFDRGRNTAIEFIDWDDDHEALDQEDQDQDGDDEDLDEDPDDEDQHEEEQAIHDQWMPWDQYPDVWAQYEKP